MPAAKYKIINKQCPHCQINFETFNGGQNARMFCSASCARKSQIISPETRAKISNTVINWIKENTELSIRSEFNLINCNYCNKLFKPYTDIMKYCSKRCSSKNLFHSEATKEKMRQAQISLLENNEHTGWRSSLRIKGRMSYPEIYIKSILNMFNISYQREYQVKKWFIDFANIENKLALEVDGSQHDLPERKKSDLTKDTYLIENGWKIFRIKWRNPKSYFNFRENTICDIKKFFGVIS